MVMADGRSRFIHAGAQRLLMLIWLGFFACSAAQAEPKACTDVINTAAPVLSNGFAFGPGNTRNQPSAIHSGNVAQLQPAMTFVAPDATGKRGALAATQQTIYFSEGSDIVARHRESGCEYWRYRISPRMILFKEANLVRSSAIEFLPPHNGRQALIFAGDNFGKVYALDAATGAVAWQRFVGTHSRHMVTGSFQIHDGVLFVPLSSVEVATTLTDIFGICCKSHGVLQALDAYTGEVRWTYHTGAPAKYHAATHSYAPSGMSIWGVPMVDAARGQVLIGTGQNFSRPTTGNSDAIVALDIKTGEVRWVFQATANDAYNVTCDTPEVDGHCDKPIGPDYDFGAPPVLAKLPSGGQAVIAGSKNGVVYSLNPDTGTLNWSTKVGAGGIYGGIHWGLAVDDQRVYAAVTDLAGDKTQLVDFLRLLGDGKSPHLRPSIGAQPGVHALDLVTGAVRWKRQFQHQYEGETYNSAYSAALAVTNDVLFAASLNGVVRALRTSDGAELWAFDTAIPVVDVDGDAGNGGTIDSVGAIPAGGELFVNSGYSNFGDRSPWQAGFGNALFVFRVPSGPAAER
jgi:polyvinyl alcohol dehydrogenase (cytochrome)